MKNYMEKVAEMLGVELGEEFDLSDCRLRYRLCKEGLRYYDAIDETWKDNDDSTLDDILAGRVEIIKKPWRPERGEYFFYASPVIKKVYGRANEGDTIDAECIIIGNCFESAAEAEAHKDEVLERYQKVLDGKLRVEFKEVE